MAEEGEVVQTSVLKTVRGALGLGIEDASFDHEVVLHVNAAIGTLVQNGVILGKVLTGTELVWDDLKDPEKAYADYLFEQVKLFVFVKTKMLFDPPPPSTAPYMNDYATELLWRLRESFDINDGRTDTDELRRTQSYDHFGD